MLTHAAARCSRGDQLPARPCCRTAARRRDAARRARHPRQRLVLPAAPGARARTNVVAAAFRAGDVPGGGWSAPARQRTFLVPTMMRDAARRARPRRRRMPRAGAASPTAASPIAPSVARGLRRVFGPVLAQTYGQAEAPMAITCLQPGAARPGRRRRAGRTRSSRCDVVDAEGRASAVGETGEVVCRGPIVMRRATGSRPEATAETTIRDGWLHTGDVGRFDDEGYLYLLDRRNDVIISGGFNVYPREVEDVLVSPPRGRRGGRRRRLPDTRWGELVQRGRQPCARADPGRARASSCADRLAGFKRPARRSRSGRTCPRAAPASSLRRDGARRDHAGAVRTLMRDPYQLTDCTASRCRQAGTGRAARRGRSAPPWPRSTPAWTPPSPRARRWPRGASTWSPRPGGRWLDEQYPTRSPTLRADPGAVAAYDGVRDGSTASCWR